MRILLVDENADFCTVLREYLREGLDGAIKSAALKGAPRPDALAVKEWNPVHQGLPEEGRDRFKWNFDVLLVDSSLGSVDPLQWLANARGRAGDKWPPVVLLTGGNDADGLVVEAMKLGVVACLPRLKLTPRRLYDALLDAVAERYEKNVLDKTLATGGYSTSVNPARVGRKAGRDVPAIPGYTIERMIGEGGTARVYLAKRTGDDLQVVLKVLLPELAVDPNVVERFMQEFSLIQKIKSVHVTRIFDLAYDNGNAYLAMEYFGAGDLRERIIAGGFPPVQALKIFAQVARALGAIHDAGVIHRDLKPHNIMFRDQHHLAIVDFGGAKSLGDTTGITKVGHIIGTPNYMSPEQITGAQVDKRTDLYSLGVILHLLLTGQTLYVATNATELMDMHLNAPIPRLPEELNGFQKLLNKLVAKDPDARFQSARELYGYIAY